jgi:hypothetical protein
MCHFVKTSWFIFPLNKGMVIHSYPHLFWVYVPILPGIPKDGRMTIAPYHDHVLRLHDQEMLLGGYPKHGHD